MLVMVTLGPLLAGCATQDIEGQNEAARSGATRASGEHGDQDVFDLRAGDCIAEAFSYAPEYHSEVEVVPCTSSRAVGRVTNLLLVERTSGPYPGDAYFDNAMLDGCHWSATAMLFPTVESWDAATV
jgi:hypothetical protein